MVRRADGEGSGKPSAFAPELKKLGRAGEIVAATRELAGDDPLLSGAPLTEDAIRGAEGGEDAVKNLHTLCDEHGKHLGQVLQGLADRGTTWPENPEHQVSILKMIADEVTGVAERQADESIAQALQRGRDRSDRGPGGGRI